MKHFSHQSKGKWKHKGNSNKKPNLRPGNNSAHKKLPCHYCGYKGQIQPGCWKKRRDNAKILLPKVSLHPTQTQPISQKNKFLWHWRYASHLVRPPTSIIDEWLVDNSAIVHMTYHISILHDVPSPFRTFFRFGWTNYRNHDEWLEDSGAIVHKTYNKSILHDVPAPSRSFFTCGWINYLNH